MTQVQNAVAVWRRLGLEPVNGGEGIWAEGMWHKANNSRTTLRALPTALEKRILRALAACFTLFAAKQTRCMLLLLPLFFNFQRIPIMSQSAL